MWTVGNLLAEAVPFLARKGVPSARLEAELLLAHTLGKDRVALYAAFTQPLSTAEVDAFREACKRRIRGEPTAYITGEKDFFSLAFHVSQDVLVPRPESEDLVQAAVLQLDQHSQVSCFGKLDQSQNVGGLEVRISGPHDRVCVQGALLSDEHLFHQFP